ncbi:unnamed protein product [Microthlaspi erraticum]|uniref:F-box domain-containing protein n=1 Tax=Microthlaspi erraticum TaxID=1685480 RepID=A0A6D2ILM6_9BRAS|nr:unnamed protein product [Microthlaspi erraticum]
MKISDLPGDLQSEILARVPAKSLSKSQTTCKRWYALFRDESFIRKNQKLGKSVRESMLLSSYRVYSNGEDLHGLYNTGVDPSIEFSGKLSSLKKDPKQDMKISQIFHCDGLMLCSTEGNNRLVIWNPCTGQTREIKPKTCYRSGDTYALGYANDGKSCRSYKILRCSYDKKDESVMIAEFEMYDLSTGSWRVLYNFTRDYGIFCDGKSLKGNAFWVCGDKETGLFLMKFDFTTEKFVRLSLPFQSFNPEDTAVLSVVKDEKLSVCHQNILEFSNVMRIWVTNKVDEADKDLSWRSEFELVVDYDKFELDSVVNVSSFLLDEENKVAVCCDIDADEYHRNCSTRIYIVGEDMYKQVYSTKCSSSSWRPILLTYVPSLVHI